MTSMATITGAHLLVGPDSGASCFIAGTHIGYGAACKAAYNYVVIRHACTA